MSGTPPKSFLKKKRTPNLCPIPYKGNILESIINGMYGAPNTEQRIKNLDKILTLLVENNILNANK